MMYLALGKVGTHRPSTSRVFQPTWSQCRCVHMTCVTVLGLDAEAGEPGEEILLALVELLAAGPRLVGAAAGVDQDRVPPGLEHEGVEAHDDLAVGA